MTDTETVDEIDDFLAHYGVKGMKWGQRRAEVKAQRKENSEKAAEAGYSPKSRSADIVNIGNRGVRNIEKRVVRGESVDSARTKEYGVSAAKGLAAAGVILATPIALSAASRKLTSIRMDRATREVANMLADERGLTSYRTLGLAFNAATGTWR